MPPGRYRRRRPEERETFVVPVRQHTGPPPPPEVLPWYWDPDREGAIPPPAAFRKQLAELDKDLAVCYSPVHERWLIWFRNPRLGREPGFPDFLHPGWQLLFFWEHPETHDFLPLTELVFANIYYISRGKWGAGKKYFEAILREQRDQVDARNRHFTNEREAIQADFRRSLLISNAGRGNKFALHHDGGLVAGPGEMAWRKETRKQRLSSEQLKHEAAEKEKAFYGR